jgi:hypothetical protein
VWQLLVKNKGQRLTREKHSVTRLDEHEDSVVTKISIESIF